MKVFSRWLGVFILLAGFGGVAYSAGVTDLQDLCTGKNNSNCPYKIDAVGDVTAAGFIAAGNYIQPVAQTLAQLQATTPTAAGQVYYCSNCTATVCVSTGTSIYGFATATSSSTSCK